jgi:TatD DNase family protein
MQTLFDAHGHLPTTDAAPPDHLRVVCGTCEADWGAVLAHGASEGLAIPMLGLHPWQVEAATLDWAARLASLLGLHRAGVGECGLDFTRKETDRSAQEAAFRIQLRLARRFHRPVAIHAVRAWGRLLAVLQSEGVPPSGALVHAYSGSPETARQLQNLGLYLSFSGRSLAAARASEALRAVEPDRLLLETDGVPGFEGVLATAAGVLGISVEELAARTWENGRRCFKELLA